MSRSKEASSRLHEKHQVILADLLRDEDNKYCADCMAKGPRWASWNLGVFMCIRCAGIHRNLGVHVSRVKSVNLDSWTPEQIESIQKGGNRHAKNLYEANLPANFRRPQDDYAVEQFIRAKYERKIYIAKGGEVKSNKEQPPPQEQKSKVTKTKKTLSTSSNSIKSTGQDQNLAVPRPTGRHSPSPLATSKSAPSSTRNSASNLLALDTSPPPSVSQPSKSQPQPLLDLLTGSTPSSTVIPSSSKPDSNSTSLNQSSDPFASTSSAESSAAASNSLNPVSAPHVGGGHQQPTGSKESIMSLYSQNQPQYSSFTAQGYPVNNYYYQQQQAAAMHMAQVASLQQQQVNQVTAQMQKIRMNQTGGPVGTGQGFSGAMSNGSSFAAPTGGAGMNMANNGAGGQTLNPTLW